MGRPKILSATVYVLFSNYTDNLPIILDTLTIILEIMRA